MSFTRAAGLTLLGIADQPSPAAQTESRALNCLAPGRSPDLMCRVHRNYAEKIMDQAETCRVTENPRAEKSISCVRCISLRTGDHGHFYRQWPDLDYYVYERESVWVSGAGEQCGQC
ncbi:hypothetical protein P4S72_18745 [Vibrio sp. PP-XX7]